MNKKRMLTKRQMGVIEDLVGGKADEVGVLKKHRVSTHVYRKWLGEEVFAEELEFLIESARREGMLEIARSAKEAAKKLIGLTTNDSAETARKACMDIISFGRKVRSKQEKRAGERGEEKSDVKIDDETAGRIISAIARGSR
jgi:hypothetical protein